MAKTSKWFVVATEGATTDGRTINRTWIEQMAANYDPKKYGAPIPSRDIKAKNNTAPINIRLLPTSINLKYRNILIPSTLI